jgi:hypothetical protein
LFVMVLFIRDFLLHGFSVTLDQRFPNVSVSLPYVRKV